MASFGTRFCWTLGIIAVVAFFFAADDLNEWLYRHRSIEQLQSDGAPRDVAARDNNRPLAGNAADGAAQSNPSADASREAQAAVAHAPAQKPGIAPVANVEKLASSAAEAVGKSVRVAAAEQTSNVLGQAEAAKEEVIAKAPSQPRDQAPAEASHRDASSDAPVESAVADAAAKSVEVAAAEQTSNVRGQEAERAQKDVIAKAPLQPPGDAPVEAISQAQTGTERSLQPKACEGLNAAQLQECVDQFSRLWLQLNRWVLRSQEAEPAQKDVAAKAPSQPPGDPPVEAISQAQTGTERSLQPKACEGLNAAQLQECVNQFSRLELQLRALQADGADRWVLRSEEAEPAQKDVTAKAPSQPLNQAPAEVSRRDDASFDAPVESPVADAAAKAAAEQTSNLRGQQAEPAKEEVIAKAPSQPLNQAPAEVSRRDDASFDAPVESPVADAAAKAAAEQTSNLRGQQAEPAKEEVIAKAPSQPLNQAPAEVSRRDDASFDAPVESPVADAAAKSVEVAAAEQTSNLRGQQAEPAKEEVIAKAPSQPPGDAPVEAISQAQTGTERSLQPKACEGLNAAQLQECVNQFSRLELQLRALQADGADRWVLRSEEAEPAQKDVTAKAPSQPLNQAPAEVSRRDDASFDAPVESPVADAAAKAAAEQTSNLRGQQAEPAKEEVIAKAPSQPLNQAPAEVSRRDDASFDAPVESPVADAAAKSVEVAAAEQTSNLRGQQAEPAKEEVIAKAPSQPLNQAPAEVSRRDDASFDAPVESPVADAAAKSVEVAAAEQTSNVRGQEAEPAKEEVIAKAPSQPLNQAPAEVSRRDDASFDAPVESPVADAAAKSVEVAAAEQTSNLRGQQAEPAKEEVIAKAPSQPLDQPLAEAGDRAQTGTGRRLQPEACEQLDAVQRQECVERLSRLEPQPRASLAAGVNRWLISETSSPVDHSPVVTASILLQSETSRLKLTIYCRRGRTYLELGRDPPDTAAQGRVRDIVVTHSIDRGASIEQRWEARGSIAYFRGDAVAFIRSLPEDGELAVRVSDGKSELHEAQLNGLNNVRKRVASACNWRESGAALVANVNKARPSSPDRMSEQIFGPPLSALINTSRSKDVKAGQDAHVQQQIHKHKPSLISAAKARQSSGDHIRKPRPYERRLVRRTPRLDEFVLFDEWD